MSKITLKVEERQTRTPPRLRAKVGTAMIEMDGDERI